MKSIKPGRGPSFMGGIGAIVAIIFGIFWTIMAVSMNTPAFFPIFGVLFIVLGIAQAVYSFKNATGENRFSAFDITDSHEEPDPLNTYFGSQNNVQPGADGVQEPKTNCFCPYCGAQTGADHLFCSKCGKKIG